MAEYKNKSVQEIKKMVGEEFDRIGRIWYRDDQEIYEAGQNVINTIIKQIKEDKKKGY